MWASAVLAVGLALLAAAGGHGELVAYAAPLLGVVLPLLAGRYIGEERLTRVLARARRVRRRPARAIRPASRVVAALLPRGGRLIADALAKRPPPLLASG